MIQNLNCCAGIIRPGNFNCVSCSEALLKRVLVDALAYDTVHRLSIQVGVFYEIADFHTDNITTGERE